MCSLLGLHVQSRRVSSTTTVKGMCLVVCHIKNNNFNKTFASTVHMWERLWFIGFLDQMLNFNRKLLPKLDQDSKSNVILVYFSVSVVFNRISRNFWANPPSFFFLMFNKFNVNFANLHDLVSRVLFRAFNYIFHSENLSLNSLHAFKLSDWHRNHSSLAFLSFEFVHQYECYLHRVPFIG